MNDTDPKDIKLRRFLQTNAPQPPPAAHDEAQRIWERIEGGAPARRWSPPAGGHVWRVAAVAMAATLLLGIYLFQRQPSPLLSGIEAAPLVDFVDQTYVELYDEEAEESAAEEGDPWQLVAAVSTD